jgi:hypothetical protein
MDSPACNDEVVINPNKVKPARSREIKTTKIFMSVCDGFEKSEFDEDQPTSEAKKEPDRPHDLTKMIEN